MKASESGLFCVNRVDNGVKITVLDRWIVEEYAVGKKGVYGELERKISIEYRFFDGDFQKSLLRDICGILLI